MSSAQAYRPTSSLPLAVPGKNAHCTTPHASIYGRMSVSPPEASESVTSGGPSYDPSATSSGYAGSASDYDASSNGSATSIDLLEYMNDRLTAVVDPLPLDRSVAKQAQTSGELNTKTRELLELQALAQRRLAATQANFADGIKTAKEVQRDLQWTQKRANAINERAKRKYPTQYRIASQRIPAPVDC